MNKFVLLPLRVRGFFWVEDLQDWYENWKDLAGLWWKKQE
jgi:hypothetical protein